MIGTYAPPIHTTASIAHKASGEGGILTDIWSPGFAPDNVNSFAIIDTLLATSPYVNSSNSPLSLS